MSRLNTEDVAYAVKCAIADFLADGFCTATVALVDSVNSDGSINAKPLLNMPFIDGTQKEHAVIPNVPILFNANTVLSTKVAAGDIVLLVFTKESLDKWTPNGKTANTLLNQQFAAGNAIAVPLISSSGTVSLQYLLTAAYASALETFLGPTGPLQLAISAGCSSGGGSYSPVTFIPATDGKTTKVKAV